MDHAVWDTFCNLRRTYDNCSVVVDVDQITVSDAPLLGISGVYPNHPVISPIVLFDPVFRDLIYPTLFTVVMGMETVSGVRRNELKGILGV